MKTTCEAEIETTHIKPLWQHHKQQLCPCWWLSGIPRTQFVDIRDVPKLFPLVHPHTQVSPPFDEDNLRSRDWDNSHQATVTAPEAADLSLPDDFWHPLDLICWHKRCAKALPPSSSPHPSVTPFWWRQLAKQRLRQLTSSHYDSTISSSFVLADDFWHPLDPICWHKRLGCQKSLAKTKLLLMVLS